MLIRQEFRSRSALDLKLKARFNALEGSLAIQDHVFFCHLRFFHKANFASPRRVFLPDDYAFYVRVAVLDLRIPGANQDAGRDDVGAAFDGLVAHVIDTALQGEACQEFGDFLFLAARFARQADDDKGVL